MAERIWLDGYSGQTVEQLVALEGTHRIDSLVLAFEQAMDQKAARVGMEKLSVAEQTILAIEGLEREVNNGGYAQFFINSSNEYTPIIVDSLRRIGCPVTAEITQRAIDAAGRSSQPIADVRDGHFWVNPDCLDALGECDGEFFEYKESIENQLFDFIKRNKTEITP